VRLVLLEHHQVACSTCALLLHPQNTVDMVLFQHAAPASMVMMRSKVGASGRPCPASSGLCSVMLGFLASLSILQSG
jgi:hypothetical protein